MIKLIDFYADWCGPCKVMDPIFEKIEKEYEGKVEFQKVDVEAEQNIASKYEIMSIPTFVILKNDKETDRRTGAMPKDMLIQWIDGNL